MNDDNVIVIEYKMNKVTYDDLMKVHAFLSDGRIFLAREKLEEILDLQTPKELA